MYGNSTGGSPCYEYIDYQIKTEQLQSGWNARSKYTLKKKNLWFISSFVYSVLEAIQSLGNSYLTEVVYLSSDNGCY